MLVSGALPSTMMLSPLPPLSLPGEIVDIVISHLLNDSKTLGVCGLVSRQWHPRTRHNHFYTIHLTPQQVRPFPCLIHSPACTFIHFISRIVFDYSHNLWAQSTGLSCSETLAMRHMPCFSHVESIRLRTSIGRRYLLQSREK